MNLADMIDAVREHSGQASTDIIKSAIQLAAEEIWNTVDLPGTLREVRVCTNSERYVTLPWEVYKIRKIRTANGRVDMELNTVTAHYNWMNFYQSEIVCRILRKVPLHTKISNASTLRFKLKRTESTDVTFTVSGSTDMEGRCIEPVIITAGNLSQDTVERYMGIPDSITKSRSLRSDTQVIDANGVELAVFPSHLTECAYYLCQMYDRCSTINSPYLGCFDVVFKPHMPPLTDNSDVFPAPFHQIVIFKALEHIYLKSDETVEVSAAYNQKALALLVQFAADENAGRTMKPSVKPNHFITKYSGKL
jgi:hypothetical protein